MPFLVLFCLKSYSQAITEKVDGKTLMSKIYVPVTEKIPTIEVSPSANSEDNLTLGKNEGSFRYGISIDENISLDNSGMWFDSLPEINVWAVKIFGKNAKSLDIEFDVFKLSKNSFIQIYSLKDNIIQGPIVYNDNNVYNSFATDLIYSDEIIIELVSPVNEKNQNDISINKVVYGCFDEGSTQAILQELSGVTATMAATLDCHNDVNCYSSYANEKGAVAMLKYNDSFFGSSFLVNDAKNDGRYLLSSRHQWSYVVGGDSLAKHPTRLAMVVVKFFYMSSSCDGSALTKNYSLTGVNVVHEYLGEPDIVLCKLIAEPVWFYSNYPGGPLYPDKAASFLGWSIISDEPTSMAGIHHPGGDLMKITFYDFKNTAYESGVGYTYVSEYTSGVFEDGSSGSPLMDQNKRLVGILHGSPLTSPPTFPSCSSVVDLWSIRISKYWDGLSQFLDPNNYGVVELNTRTSSIYFPSSYTPYLTKDKTTVCYGQTATIEIERFGEIFENNVSWSITNSSIINSSVLENGKKLQISPKYSSSNGKVSVTTQIDFGSFTKTYYNTIIIGKPNASTLSIYVDGDELSNCDYTYAEADCSITTSTIMAYDWDIPYSSDWYIDEEYGNPADFQYVEIDYFDENPPSYETINIRAQNLCGWSGWKSTSWPVDDCAGGYYAFTLSPNPVEEVLTVSFDINEEAVGAENTQLTQTEKTNISGVPVEVSIFDKNKSQILYRKGNTDNNMELDVSTIPAGDYFIHVAIEGEKTQKRHLIID